MEPDFEEKHQHELISLESAIVSIYRENRQMTDYSVMEALDVLIRFYQAESLGRAAPSRRLEPLDQKLHDRVGAICEMLIGRGELLDEDGNAVNLSDQNDVKSSIGTSNLEEILSCLKRIRKSVTRWNKSNGRRGYLDFVSQYL